MIYTQNAVQSGPSLFCITAEEVSGLHTGHLEWSYGNGANTPLTAGVVIPVNSALKYITLSTAGVASCEVAVLKNGAEVAYVTTSASTTGVSGVHVEYSAGDILNFKTVQGSSESIQGIVTAWLSPNY